ncbi:MAG TPA: bifunctional (p)ppGpp synthetase/guanosine-3',5'-bis(diphosphate) 3'-pyrophosphohydrolase [Aeromicrobium sp.]|nr:bifunctional (p)ppGpp synthetase/guanosine-3',5'-bis(diphosphate) 3'-pyrophosphohydrolase [Aeromicrobium sp.]
MADRVDVGPAESTEAPAQAEGAPSGDSAPASARVRSRLARIGRGSSANPVLDPLLRIFREGHPKSDAEAIARAYSVAEQMHEGQLRKSGDPYITHPLAVATILAELGMPAPVLIAALLHDTVEDTEYTLDQLRDDFGEEVVQLVDGVTKLDKVKYGESAQSETIRKMVVAMSRDIRVLVIKLADRLHNMRTLRYLRHDKQERIATETLEIFAPLAHRLGMNTIKWELEDLAFATLHPKVYDEIVRLVADRAPSREQFLERVIKDVESDLRHAKVKATVTGRPKHYYSIYQKMLVRGHDFTDIFDLVGVRILVDSVADCYGVLGVLHARWNPIPGRFKDYISLPKFNMYQSLHTTVIGPQGKAVEMQIRTFAQHRRAEYGVAAHWKYKEDGVAGRTGGRAPQTEDMAWLRELIDWQSETSDSGDFLESLRFDMKSAGVYAYTPRGDVIHLPEKASPIDFAYAVHTEVGHACIGARVNGRLVSLESELQTGDVVEIFTSKSPDAGPSRDWLDIVKSPRARNKIRAWFTKERREEAIDHGRDILAKQLRKENLPLHRLMKHDTLDQVAKDLHLADVSALYAAVGEGNVGSQNVVERVIALAGGRDSAEDDLAEATVGTRSRRHRAPSPDSGVVIEGVTGDVLAKLARCCTPVPGDEISGFVTRASGVSVHRTDCVNFEALLDQPERIVKVHWAPTAKSTFLVAIQVEALDRPRLLSDITRVISDQHVNILSASVTTGGDRVARSRFTFEMGDAKHLDHVMSAVRNIDGVFDAFRITQ